MSGILPSSVYSQNVYLLNPINLLDLLRNFWKPNIFDLLSRTYSNPIDLINNIFTLPFTIDITNLPTTMNINIGNYEYSSSYPITLLTSYGFDKDTQIASFSFSADSLLSNSFLDYDAYSNYILFLPYIGNVNIEYSLLKKGLVIRYYCDLSNGTLVANLLSNIGELYSTYSTNVAIKIPFSGANYIELKNALINGFDSMVRGATNTTMSALSNLVPGPTQSINSMTKYTTRNPKTGRQITTATRTTQKEITQNNSKFNFDGSFIESLWSSSIDLLKVNIPPTIINKVSGDSDLFNQPDRPFIIKNTYESIEDNLIQKLGKKNIKYRVINGLSGFLQVYKLFINFVCTNSEYEELNTLFLNGVYINA